MRGEDANTAALFSYLSCEARVPADHPLRPIRAIVDEALAVLSPGFVAFIILGSVLEGLPAIVLFGPLLFPVAKAMGVHEVHYAMVVILAMGIGLFAPPFGIGFFSACAIGRTNPDDSLWRIWPYIGALVISLLIIAAIPWLSIGFL